MTDMYCEEPEIRLEIEVELWNLKVKGTDVLGYNQHFQELALLRVRMFSEESDKIEKYVGGLPDMIHGSVSVMASKAGKLCRMIIEMANCMMDKKISTIAESSRSMLESSFCNKCKLPPPIGQYCTVPGITRKVWPQDTGDCRNPAAARNQRTLTCYECGNPGHYRSDCPELKNRTMETRLKVLVEHRGLVHAFRRRRSRSRP
ncbi:DNA-directed DNA polymerase [Tanacetum coccineum]